MLSPYPVSRTDDLVIQELKDEILIYDLQINRAFCLNQISALVWNLCDGRKSISEINLVASRKLRLSVSEEIIWLTLEKLSEQNLLVKAVNAKHLYHGVSRREAVKKIGLASAVSLPLISAITAPRAAQAQSVGCAGPGFHTCPCQADGDCLDQAICVSNSCECACVGNTCAGSGLCPCDPNPPPCTEGCPCAGECDCPCAPRGGCGETCGCIGECGCPCDENSEPCP
jgi:hypothetical protein